MSNEFLNELRNHFTYEMEIKDKLETKATNMVTVAGIMAAIFMGFGAQFLANLDNTNSNFATAAGLLVAELVITVVSVVFSILAYRVKGYDYPFVRKEFLGDDGKFVTSKIDDYKVMDAKT